MAKLFALCVFVTVIAGAQGLTQKEIDECVRSHNELRHLHEDTPALEWDAGIAAGAQKWSNYLARIKSGQHDHAVMGKLGENWWYWSWYDASKVYSCADAVRAWYDEIKDYNWGTRRSNGGVVGHFTQLVWKSIRKVGVGITPANGYNGKKWLFIVARYDVAGNTNKINGKWLTKNGRADTYGAYGLMVKPRKQGSKVPSIESLRNGKGTGKYGSGSSSGGKTGGGSTSEKCSDSDARCPGWANRGECTKNPGWMKKNCQKSCKTCNGGSNGGSSLGGKTGGSTSEKCIDSDARCSGWANRGECTKNPGWMKKNCQKSCRTCNGGSNGCSDSDARCSGWANRGECTKNPSWMKKNCQKSCRTCNGGSNASACKDTGASRRIHCGRLKNYCGANNYYGRLTKKFCCATCAKRNGKK